MEYLLAVIIILALIERIQENVIRSKELAASGNDADG